MARNTDFTIEDASSQQIDVFRPFTEIDPNLEQEIEKIGIAQLAIEAYTDISSALAKKDGPLMKTALQDHYKRLVAYLRGRSQFYLKAVEEGKIKMGEGLEIADETVLLKKHTTDNSGPYYEIAIKGNGYKSSFDMPLTSGPYTREPNIQVRVEDNPDQAVEYTIRLGRVGGVPFGQNQISSIVRHINRRNLQGIAGTSETHSIGAQTSDRE